MKLSPNHVIAALAGIALLAVGVAWQQYWQAAEWRALASGSEDEAALRQRLLSLDKRNRDLEARLAARPDAPRPAATPATADPNDPPARAPGPNRDRGGPRGGDDPRAAMMLRPEIQRLQALQQRVALDSRYAGLFKSLNLAPDQLARFKDLLIERDSAMRDLMDIAREQGIDPRSDPAGFRKLLATAQADTTAALQSLLGEDGYAQYEQYQRTGPQRATVSQLQQSLSYTNSPLTDAQAAQLVQILGSTAAPENPGPRPENFGGGPPGRFGGPGGGGPGGPGGFGGGGGGGATISTEAVALAQSVLSTTQFQALQQLQQIQQAQQTAQQVMRDAGPPAGGGPPRRNGPGGG